MDKTYRNFSRKYLLVLEGGQADSRRKLVAMAKIFLRHKRKNYLTLAFGLLKVPMVEAAMKARTPEYMRVAACNLLLGWLKRARRKNFQRWLARWAYVSSCIIFTERTKAAATIQTLLRRGRDRKKFILMHQAKPYLGILSDIKLGPYRHRIRYRLPALVRTDRRMYWLAATLIQTCFRCWFESKDYFLKKRRIILLQSIFRMWPKYQYYRRLKRATIRSQAWARRTLWQTHYRLLKKAAIIVQKYVRRYECILMKLQLFDQIWEEIEEEKYAVIKIQQRYRIRRARRKIKGRKLYKKMLQWGALVIQRNWYRKKRAFHTFFLMCALRERESQDIALEKLATKMGRFQCARRIQRAYHKRFWRRVVENVIRVQCWYRGRLGYRITARLRQERWATRKLHHWMKCRLRKRRVMARRIQRWWWRLRKMRLLKHLWYLQRLRDKAARYQLSEERHRAALRIQAIVKGVWDRRWVKRHRAAMVIQKNWRFLFGLKKWKRLKKDQMLRGVQRCVSAFIDKAIKIRMRVIIRHHHKLVTSVQALARGYVVRCHLHRARLYAAKLARAVIRIQRFWRKSGELMKAVEDVLARKRIEANPFKHCYSMHEILLTLQLELRFIYSSNEPRVGMRVPDFLYRLGYGEYMDLFPRRDFKFASELQHLTLDKLTELYQVAQNRKKATSKKPNGSEEESKAMKNRKVPVQDLQAILAVATLPLYPKAKKDIQSVQNLLHFPDYVSPQGAMDIIRQAFLKKFGKHLTSRATNMAREIVEDIYTQYNSFHSFAGQKVMTKGHILRALSLAPESGAVLSTLEEVRQNTAGIVWDDAQKAETDRMRRCLQVVQMAYDRSSEVLRPGSILKRLEKTISRAATYKRKADYLKKKAAQHAQRAAMRQKMLERKGMVAKGKSATSATDGADDASEMPSEKRALSDNQLPLRITAIDLVECQFYGPYKFLELEYYSAMARLYYETLDEYLMLSMAIQSLKNAWGNKAMRRAVQHERREVFLANATSAYLLDQGTDKVRLVWEKTRRKEMADKKYSNLIMAARARKFAIEAYLTYIPRYHVQTYYDENGYAYYIDERNESSYEMPIYSFLQYLKVEFIQQRARKYIVRARLRRLQKEEEERLAILRMEEEMALARKLALRACVVSVETVDDPKLAMGRSRGHISSAIVVDSMNNPAISKTKKKVSKVPHGKAITSHHKRTLEEELESQLPWKYRFEQDTQLFPGMWAVLLTPHKDTTKNTRHNNHPNAIAGLHHHGNHANHHPAGQSAHPPHDKPRHSMNAGNRTHVTSEDDTFLLKQQRIQQQRSYDIVVVFRVRLTEGLCDVRSVKGHLLQDIPLSRLYHVNYAAGFAVECRYRHRKLFYRAHIHRADDFSHIDRVIFDVTYEDGEREYGLARDAIRPNASYLAQWWQERDAALKELFIRYKRQAHFLALKRQRIQAAWSEGASSPVEDRPPLPPATSAADSAVVVAGAGDEDAQSIHSQRENDDVDGDKDDTASEVASVSSTAMVVAQDATPIGKTSAPEPDPASSQQLPHATANSTGKRKPMLKVRIKVTKGVLQFGWTTISPPLSETPVYFHRVTEVQTDHNDPPFYSAAETLLAQRIQLRWFRHVAMRHIRRMVLRINLVDYMNHVVQQCSQIAYVGYKFEGLTSIQLLFRAGYAEVAETIRDHYRDLHRNVHQLTIDEIVQKRPEEFERLGIMQSTHVKELKEFQYWWKKTMPYERENKLALINYYARPEDPRSIHECIRESLDVLFKKFAKVLKTSATKTKRAVENLVNESHFPVSHAQIETYLKKYNDKHDQARVCNGVI